MSARGVKAAVGALILVGALAFALYVPLAKAGGTVYIRPDGSVDPSSAPIDRDGDIYTLTGDINDSIVVERNNIVFDGAGYTVGGAGTGVGISLTSRSNVTVKNTTVTGFEYGIYLDHSGKSTVLGNTANNNSEGIRLYYSDNNRVSNNTANNNGNGIRLWDSIGNTVLENTANNNRGHGIYVYYSYINTVLENTANNNRGGIYLSGSANNRVLGNNAANNGRDGISLYSSWSNTVSGNTANNNPYGIYLYSASGNSIHHNNVINNTLQSCVVEPFYNAWDADYPSGGNYWSDYHGTDLYSGPHQNETGSDHIGDTAYVIYSLGNNKDNYPLMTPCLVHTVVSDGTDYQVTTLSNSTISKVACNQTTGELSFNITGPDGTTGFCRVTVPRTMLQGNFTVLVDGTPVNYTHTEDAENHYIYLTYNHTTHTIQVIPYAAATRLPHGATAAYSGDPACRWRVNVNVFVLNQGNETEDFTVTAHYNYTNLIAAPTLTGLPPGNSTIITLTWNLTGTDPCRYNYTGGYYLPYAITVNVSSPTLGETTRDAGAVTVRFPGDGSGDGWATGSDLAILGRSWYKQHPEAGYDWRADWSGDGMCTGTDLAVLGRNWYKSAPAA